MQHGVAPVGERHVVERDVPLDALDAARVGRARDVGLDVEHVVIFSIAAAADCTWP